MCALKIQILTRHVTTRCVSRDILIQYVAQFSNPQSLEEPHNITKQLHEGLFSKEDVVIKELR